MKAVHSIELMCRILKVSRGGFYEWRGRAKPAARDYSTLKEAIRNHFQKSRGTYGHRSIREELRKESVRASRKLVLRLMKEMGLEAAPWKPSPYAAQREAKEATVCDHLLQRDFKPAEKDKVWTSDITYIWTLSGWVYLAVVMDLHSRRIVGWSVSDKPDTALALKALSEALVARRYARGRGLVFHSDQGCQYTSQMFQAFLKERGITGSMSRRGQCWDNAPTESWFKTFKRETGIRKLHLKGVGAVEALAFDWIETWYNLRRRHTFLDYCSPVEFELKRAA